MWRRTIPTMAHQRKGREPLVAPFKAITKPSHPYLEHRTHLGSCQTMPGSQSTTWRLANQHQPLGFPGTQEFQFHKISLKNPHRELKWTHQLQRRTRKVFRTFSLKSPKSNKCNRGIREQEQWRRSKKLVQNLHKKSYSHMEEILIGIKVDLVSSLFP